MGQLKTLCKDQLVHFSELKNWSQYFSWQHVCQDARRKVMETGGESELWSVLHNPAVNLKTLFSEV